jgi:hypothetical protein
MRVIFWPGIGVEVQGKYSSRTVVASQAKSEIQKTLTQEFGMPAPEIGQAKAMASQAVEVVSQNTESGEATDSSPSPTDPMNLGLPGSDGTVSLDELPDEDIFALARAVSDRIGQIAENATREQVVEKLHAAGIERVLPKPV